MTLKVGFIGLGTMGLPMARHMINRGFKLKLTRDALKCLRARQEH